MIGGDEAAALAVSAAAPGKPILRASLEPDALAAAPLIGREVVAFAGIARPEKFYATLRRVGAQVVATRDFPDHHVFTPREIDALVDEATRRGALLATTEKDRVRLTGRQAPGRRHASGHAALRGAGGRAGDARGGFRRRRVNRMRRCKSKSAARRPSGDVGKGGPLPFACSRTQLLLLFLTCGTICRAR